MARQSDPHSVSSRVAELKLNEHIRLDNPYTSVMVMVCHLKKKEAHKNKLFKIKSSNDEESGDITIVTRIK